MLCVQVVSLRPRTGALKSNRGVRKTALVAGFDSGDPAHGHKVCQRKSIEVEVLWILSVSGQSAKRETEWKVFLRRECAIVASENHN